MNDDFRYSIDLSTAKARVEKIIECIKRLREQYDIRRFEYTNHLRIAPTEIPVDIDCIRPVGGKATV